MEFIVEYNFYNPERNEKSHVTDKTLKEYAQKNENSPWYLEFIYNTQFFDKVKCKTKNLSTKHDPKKKL